MDSDSTLVLVFLVLSAFTFSALGGVQALLSRIGHGKLKAILPDAGVQASAVRTLGASADEHQRLLVALRLLSVAASFSFGVALLAVRWDVAWPVTLLAMVLIGGTMALLHWLLAVLVNRLSATVVLRLSVVALMVLWPWRTLLRLATRAVPGRFQPAQRAAAHPSEANQSVEEQIAEEPLEPRERAMIHAILHLEETAVREIMVPRVDVIAVDVENTLEQAIEVVRESGHSRLPVYRDTLDNVVGILYARDLLKAIGPYTTAKQSVEQLVRSCFFVPESKQVDELLQELQELHIHIAVVVDEYGGVAGIVTMEDLLEEIVGEIEDEFEASEPAIEVAGKGEAVVDARISLDTFNETFRSAIAGVGFDTLGGFLYSQLGKIPSPGDRLQANGLRFEVHSTLGRRIKKVRVHYAEESVDEDGRATD